MVPGTGVSYLGPRMFRFRFHSLALGAQGMSFLWFRISGFLGLVRLFTVSGNTASVQVMVGGLLSGCRVLSYILSSSCSKECTIPV